MTATTEQLRTALLERFDRLQGQTYEAGAMQTVDLPVQSSGADLLLGRDDDGAHLLVPLEQDGHRAFKDDRRSAGVHLLLRPLELDGSLRWYADLVCLQTRLYPVFVSLLADAVGRLESAEDSAERQLRRCLADWRALVTSGERLLGTRQLAGLFGELTVLIRCLEHDGGATSLWRGPLNEPHDFEAEGPAVEVKTSLADDGSIVRINGLGQLDVAPDGELLLHHLRVAEASQDALSVVDLVERAEDLASDNLLASRLFAAGYRQPHEDVYRRTAFRILDESWYRVDDEFPRIVGGLFRDGVPPGIGGVDYELDLGLAAASVVSKGVAEAHIKLMVSAR